MEETERRRVGARGRPVRPILTTVAFYVEALQPESGPPMIVIPETSA